MAEAEGFVLAKPRTIGPDHVPSDQRGQAALDVWLEGCRRELVKRPTVEQRSLHRCVREQRPLVVGQRLEACRKESMDGGRDRQIGQLVPCRPAAVLTAEQPFV